MTRSFSGGWLSLAMMLLSAGCVGQRYVNTTLYGPTGKPAVHDEAMDVPVVPDDAHTSLALAATPTGVQSTFGDLYRGAQVTNVQAVPTGTGQMLYKITYIEDGQAGVATYHADGTSVDRPDGYIVVTRPDSLGRPHPHPHPQPATPPATAPSNDPF